LTRHYLRASPIETALAYVVGWLAIVALQVVSL